MNLPSVKTLERAFPGKGRELRLILESPIAARYHPAAVALAAQCHNPPTLTHSRMVALNAVAECHGVEYARAEEGGRSESFEYLNTGDTYTPTIIRFDSGRYIVASWGDIVEKGNYI